jgi:hypothetical protein
MRRFRSTGLPLAAFAVVLVAGGCQGCDSGPGGGGGGSCEGVPAVVECPECTPCTPTTCDAEFTSDCATCGHGTNDCGQPCTACFEGTACTPVRDLGAGVDCGVCPRYFSVAVAPSEAGRIVSSPEGIDCGETCAARFAEGTRVALAAEPAGGVAFTGWCGAAQGASACTSVEVGADTFVGAGFGAGACTPPAPFEIRDLRFDLAEASCPPMIGARLTFGLANNTSLGLWIQHLEVAGPEGWGGAFDLPCVNGCAAPLPFCMYLDDESLADTSTVEASFDLMVGPAPPSGEYVVELTGTRDDGAPFSVSATVTYECVPGPSPERCGCALVDCTATVEHATGVACDAGVCAYAACEEGYTDCDGDRTNGCERRGRHCGETLASGQDARSLVVAGGTLFWADNAGAIVRMPAGGGTPEVMVDGTPDRARGLVTDGATLFWGAVPQSGPGVSVHAMPIGGGTPQILDAFAGFYATAYTVSYGYVYFSFESESNSHPGRRWVGRVPTTGGASAWLYEMASFLNAGVNDTQLFVLGSYSLVMMPVGGGAQTALGMGMYGDSGSGVAATADSVYVSGRIDQPSRQFWVRRVALDGSGREDVAQVSALGPMIRDDASVYWADDAISTAPLAGGTPVTLVASPGIRAMAVDDTYVYWSSSDGTINRAPKD